MSFHVYDMWVPPVGGRVRPLSGAPEQAPKFGGWVAGAGQKMGRAKHLGVLVWPFFVSDTTGGDALSSSVLTFYRQ